MLTQEWYQARGWREKAKPCLVAVEFQFHTTKRSGGLCHNGVNTSQNTGLHTSKGSRWEKINKTVTDGRYCFCDTEFGKNL